MPMIRKYFNKSLACCEIWLTNDESVPGQDFFDEIKAGHPGCRTVVFRSGKQELACVTAALLQQNLNSIP